MSHTTGTLDAAQPLPSLRHRLTAVGALACLSLAVAVLAYVVVRSLPEVLVPTGLAVLAAWGTWKALAHRAARRAVFGVLGGVAALATVVTAAALTTQFPGVLLVLVLVALGAVLAGGALSWVHQPAGRLVGKARHPVLIVNPRSGDGSAVRSGVAD